MLVAFSSHTSAFSFAKALRQELAKENIATRTGLDVGKVLIGNLPLGGKDIGGMPVNIASKIAQDKGEFGKIYLSSRCKDLVDVSQFREISYTVSGVAIVAYEV